MSLVTLLLALAPLLLARSITPSTQGMGTHTQLGLPACAFQSNTGLPCVSCGMTTSFAHATRGHVVSAFLTQPMGTLLALACAMLAVVAAVASVTGASLAPLAARILRPRVILILAVLAVAAWGYKLSLVWTGGA